MFFIGGFYIEDIEKTADPFNTGGCDKALTGECSYEEKLVCSNKIMPCNKYKESEVYRRYKDRKQQEKNRPIFHASFLDYFNFRSF